MTKRAMVFVDIDTQFDFMHPDGTLYVPGAIDLLPNLKKLVEHAQQHNIPVVASVDAHPDNDPEFAQFPPHCVRNTVGQKKMDETLTDSSLLLGQQATNFALPQSDKAINIVLEKTIFSIFGNENATPIFRELDADRYVVFGVATDYCVKAAVLGLRERGHRVSVVSDAISGVTPEGSATALAEMVAAGADMITTRELLSC